MAPKVYRKRPRIYNTPFESGIRSLILLTACYPASLSLYRLVALDYMAVHSADVGGQSSLHPNEESRSAELLVRRKLVGDGLSLMATRGLVDRYATQEGFRYRAGEEAGSFVDCLKSEYSVALKERASWLGSYIVPLHDDDFQHLVHERISAWSSEFHNENGSAL
ncbi:MAG: threonine transporter [Proteobacteria bacterium]|nr:threonine transporter [Pseudomonadota bacterium]